MRLGKVLFLTLLLVLFGSHFAGAATIPVTTTITAAIASASDGDTIVIPSGNYNENVVINGFYNLTLTGAGAGATTISNAAGTVVGIINSQRITVKNLSVDGGGTATYGIGVGLSLNVNIQNCTVENFTTYGIYCVDNGKVAVKKCISQNNGYGIYADTIYNFKIQLSNINTNNFGIFMQLCRDTLITKNTVTNNPGLGVTIALSQSTVVKQNKVIANPGAGIAQISFGTNANIYTKNVITDNGDDGVQVLGGLPTFIGNNISNNGGNGVHSLAYISYLTLMKNTISGNVMHGVYMEDSTGYLTKNNISGHAGYGVYELLTTTTTNPPILTLTSNKITDNGAGVGFGDSNGVGILNAEKNFITGSLVAVGIQMGGGLSALLDKNKISMNPIGIVMVNETQTITNSLVYGNLSGGIAAGDQSVLYKNKVKNNGGHGILGFGASHVEGNVVMDNTGNGIDGSGTPGSGSGSLINDNKAFGNGDGATTFDLYDNAASDVWIDNKIGTYSLP